MIAFKPSLLHLVSINLPTVFSNSCLFKSLSIGAIICSAPVKGKPFVAANTKAWKSALKRAGIEDFRWHDLRHTWATWQRQAGTPTHELQRLGGWKTALMVERYAHVAPDNLAHAASRLDDVFKGYDLATVR